MPFKQLDPSISQSIDEKPQSYGAIKSLCYILAVFEIIWGDIPRKRNDISSAHANDHLPEKTCQKHPLSSSWSWPGLSKHCPGGEAYFEASRLRPADLRRAWETREVINQKKHPRFYCIQKVGTPYIYTCIYIVNRCFAQYVPCFQWWEFHARTNFKCFFSVGTSGLKLVPYWHNRRCLRQKILMLAATQWSVN